MELVLIKGKPNKTKCLSWTQMNRYYNSGLS